MTVAAEVGLYRPMEACFGHMIAAVPTLSASDCTTGVSHEEQEPGLQPWGAHDHSADSAHCFVRSPMDSLALR